MASSTNSRVERTLLYSILEGICYSVMVGAGETYFVPYALFLGGSNWLLGLFTALPICVGSLSQLFSERLLYLLGSRKRVISIGVGVQVLTFVPMMLVHHLDAEYRAEILLGTVCLYWICGLIIGPSWSSLLGDLVPEVERGSYFGRRNRFIQIATFLSIVVCGVLLWHFKCRGTELVGFTAVFTIAAVARLASLALLLFHWEPPLESPPTTRSLGAVVSTLRNRDQRALVAYLSLMSFGVYVSAPFFSAYMLRPLEQHGLQWSYITYTAVNGIAVFFKFVFLPLWGAASDRFGSRKCLTLAGWLVCILPFPWLLPQESLSLYFAAVCVTQTWGGLAWAGHELCSFNFLLDSAGPAERPRLVASMNIVNGIMIFAGSMLGVGLVAAVPEAINPFLVVFLVSGLCRFTVSGLLLGSLHEIRVVEKISYSSLFFRVSSVRPTIGPGLRFFVLPHRTREAPPEGEFTQAPAEAAPSAEPVAASA